jgi:PmbA protein
VSNDGADADDLADLAARIAAQADGGAGEQIEVYVSRGVSTSVRAYDDDVEAFTQATSAGVGIRVVIDGRQGFASAGSLDGDILLSTLAEARDNARFAEPDPHVGLAQPDALPPPSFDLWRDATLALGPDSKIDLALDLERRVRAADPRISGVRAASYADTASERAIATSTGIRRSDRATYCSMSVLALARDDSGTTTGSGFSLGREPDELDADRAVTDAVARATGMLGARQPESGRVAIVLEPRLTATLLGIVGGTLSAEAVLKGRSLFAERVGEVVASPLLELADDPTDPRSTGAAAFDGEGLAHRRVPLVERGVLQGFLHNTYTARRAGTVSTASAVRGARSAPGAGPSALVVAPGSGTFEELLAGVDHGVLVQSLSGLHSGVNSISGDFSVGVEGYLIRGGERAEPAREATLGSTIQRLLANIRAVGADLEYQPGGTGAVTIVIDDVTLSGR